MNGPAAGRDRRLAALRLLPLLAGLAAVAVFLGTRPERTADATPLSVVVTVPPQAWLVRRIGGEGVGVEVLLPPGADVHTYEPTPQQVERLARSRLLVTVGHPALALERQLVAAAARREPPPRLVEMTGAARGLDFPVSPDDPHLWVSPAVMAATARHIADALAQLDPAAAAGYHRRLVAVLAEIETVDAELRRDLSHLERRTFFVYHPSWGALAHEYGLEQVAIEADGKEPPPRRLVELVERARDERARAVFVQRGVADRPARVLAAEIGAEVVPLDALAEDWPEGLRLAGARLREALGG